MSMLERLKSTVASITQADYTDVAADQALNLDSIHRISLIVALEEEFDIEIDSDELGSEMFDTFEQMGNFIETCIAQ